MNTLTFAALDRDDVIVCPVTGNHEEVLSKVTLKGTDRVRITTTAHDHTRSGRFIVEVVKHG